ncbi:1,4-dihydroxy-2-naphthoate polyprenyltransferase [Actinosynnema pretiosum subsp. pretiosum]|uniref:1,4-dihydroxy-2-naphthoate octaprenyltransferase n=2 Tax=Actinosynnema TaxID=40566 RepID=C6WND1_ACTMD|nr:1,4-dihydroxy-2-naphthoate polyprenyltransferase [Actinosynnema mirum]ACU40495.1 1,4-dihydroxy-2-naphthoateoctaprenyltransferase [Actinosynnema mirum DSM 43827]AXX34009.1 1,4-dihydroxy-2-naphthoate polyprenyltransferase [Actinosynnema pretiosum subsp. pretiosum]QUF02252.1 1,4-dihydroxy-2-naphthoate polyprenyltransferase [Actinosynnema pretiosum subsp. pretiosum]
MATLAQWISGTRPRTLPNSIAPVLVGAGAAFHIDAFDAVRTLLALLVSMAFQVGVNFANDYSDGIRGTDANRVGPFRLVGSGAAQPKAVRNAAFAALGVGALAGLALVALSGYWWLIGFGAVCIAGAWFYTGGKKPYGYAGLGELAVFLFFGPAAVLGTLYVQAGEVTGIGIGGSVAMGAFSTAVMVANTLRDIPTDLQAGKRTMATTLGDRDTRYLYLALVAVPFVITAANGVREPLALLGFLSLPLAALGARRVLKGDKGKALIPVLRDTGLAMLLWAVATAGALVLG